jgi:hypothetical protein
MTTAKLRKLLTQAGMWLGLGVLAVFSIRASKAPEGFFASLGNQLKALFNTNGMA